MATSTKQTQNSVLKLAESGILLALSIVLFELVPVIEFPFGGSVTLCAQLPIVILGYRHGVKWGVFTGFALAIIELIFGLSNFGYVQGIGSYLILALADYLVAFTVLGLGGMFKNKFKNQALEIASAAVIVSALRFVCHFISGATIWADYANSDFFGVLKYSFTYNGSYMFPELILTAVGAFVIGSIFELRGTMVGIKKRK